MGYPVVTGTYDEDGNRTLLAEAVKAFADAAARLPVPEDVVLLVHPNDGESVVDALRRHFEAAGAGTVTVATADGPRDVGVPSALAGVRVFESTLIPQGEVRIAPTAATLARTGQVTL
jgi:hypothetical protein